ncbi:MAG: thioredoxin family protein [Verrucomicrobia bacterium]|nr:thioredoxin family protein [Verrucomicrobiota bacterium]
MNLKCRYLSIIAITVSLALLPGVSTAKSKGEKASKVFLPDELLDAAGKAVSGKYVGLYFSASWCPPCRTFTPKLVEFHKANKEKFEVLLVSADNSEKAQANYMKKYMMPWLAVKHQSIAANLLVKKMEVSGIPFLVILGPDGSVVTKDGRDDVNSMGNKALLKWKSTQDEKLGLK